MKTPTKNQSIYIIRLSSIGDVMIAARTAYMLSKMRHEKIVFISDEPCIETLRNYLPHIDVVSYKDISRLENLEAAKVIIDLQNNAKSRKIIKKIPCSKETICKKKNAQQRFRIGKIIKARFSSWRKVTNDVPKLFSQISLNNDCARLALSTYIDSSQFNDYEHLSKSKIWDKKTPNDQETIRIAIAPGASFEPKKAPINLLASSITDAVEHLKKNMPEKNIHLVLIGSKEDAQDCSLLAMRLSNLRDTLIDNRAGLCSLVETANLLSTCNVVLTNDSSLGHIAENFGVPSIVIFGPTSESFGFYPVLSNSLSVSAPIGCRPCSKHGKRPCRYKEQYCFTKIDPVVISKAIISSCQTEVV